MEEMNTGFEEFASAFSGESDYQTADTGTEAEPETTTEEPAFYEAEEGSESEETEIDADGQESEEASAETAAEAVEAAPEQKFAIKVNKETKEVGLEEMTALAQKGADYDRVKGQLTEARQQVQTLQSELDNNKQTFEEGRKISESVKRISKDLGVTAEELLRRVQVNWRMNNFGETQKEAEAHIDASEARAKLAEIEAERNADAAAEGSPAERAKRDLAEFRDSYPDVELSTELLDQMKPDVQQGLSLKQAYQKIEAAKRQEEIDGYVKQIEDLRQQLEAEKQNKRNRASSPGSQRDSGGQRAKSEFDAFAAAFGL